MKKIFAYRQSENAASINQLSIQREWMDETVDKHAYHCFPIVLTNGMGWGISFPEDISFIWDGISDTTDKHIKVLKGEKYVFLGRGNATISFITNVIFKTDEDVTLLTMPVPNYFNKNAQCFTTLISTSFYKSSLPIAWKVLEPNVEILIPADTPIASIIPVSLNSLQNYEMQISNKRMSNSYYDKLNKYFLKFKELASDGKWANLYRDGLDENGNIDGKHELKSIKLKTILDDQYE